MPSGARDVFLQNHPDRLWSPNSLLFNGYRVSYSGVKQPGSEVDHLPLSSAEVSKNLWSSTSIPLYAFMAWTGLTIPVLYLWLKRSIVESIDDGKIQVSGQLYAPTSLPMRKEPSVPTE